MHNLPVAVADEDIADMFAVADSDSDGRISYKEFQKMINPPKPPEGPKPTKQDFVKRFSQVISDQGDQCEIKKGRLYQHHILVWITRRSHHLGVDNTEIAPCFWCG